MRLGIPGSTGVARETSNRVRLRYTARETINCTTASAAGGSGPATMQKLTIIHYLQSLAPIAADPPKEAVPLQILLFVSDRSPAILSVAGLLGLAGLIIFISGRLVRRMEIDYAAE